MRWRKGGGWRERYELGTNAKVGASGGRPAASGKQPQEAETEFRARSARYVPDHDSVEIVTARNVGFLVPRAWIGPFANLHPDQLVPLDVWPDGSAIELDALDMQVSVHGLLSQVLPTMLPARFLAGLFGSRGGRSTSDAKKATARENGRKGGRPRKPAKPNAAQQTGREP